MIPAIAFERALQSYFRPAGVTIAAGRCRLPLSHKSFDLDLIQDQHYRLKDFEKQQTQAYQQRLDELQAKRLEDERSIRHQFMDPAREAKDQNRHDSPTRDRDGPEHER